MRKTHFTLNTIYNFPNVGCNAVLAISDTILYVTLYVVRKKADAYQPMSFKDLK